MTYTTIPRRWPHSTIACLASGPSLTPEDVAYVRGRVRVIAVNEAIRLAPFADVLYSSDWIYWLAYKGVPEFTGMKVAVEQGGGAGTKWYERVKNLQILRHTGIRGLEHAPDSLRCNANSGAAAINLAMHFGASRVLLLGYNCGSLRGRQHFLSEAERPTLLQSNTPSPYDLFLRHFDTMHVPLAAAGVDVINCTPASQLQVFRHAALRDVLAADAVPAPDALEEAVA